MSMLKITYLQGKDLDCQSITGSGFYYDWAPGATVTDLCRVGRLSHITSELKSWREGFVAGLLKLESDTALRPRNRFPCGPDLYALKTAEHLPLLYVILFVITCVTGMLFVWVVMQTCDERPGGVLSWRNGEQNGLDSKIPGFVL